MATKFNLVSMCLVQAMVSIAFAANSSYESIKLLHDSILSPAKYPTTLRPLRNQSDVLEVHVSFSLVAIVSVDDVKQELITNGFLFLFWDDETRGWDYDDYGHFNRLAPDPKQMWRPRLLLINTLTDRDPFEDKYSHTFLAHDGGAGWVPGGIFQTYCRLNLQKFPFDVQNCYIQMCPISYTNKFVSFVNEDEMNLAFYFPNPGWELLQTKIVIENVSVVQGETFSCPTFTFKLKRRPTTVVLNVILPIVFLSVLNNLVFFIPVESGEKISYAITVLLSLSVFLSMVSTMTPQVSDVVPALTIYLFTFLLSSVLTVGAVIFTVYLHNMDEKETSRQKCKSYFDHAVTKMKNAKTAVSPINSESNKFSNALPGAQPVNGPETKTGYNKYRPISEHIDKVFFVMLTLVWIIMTVWFFVFTNL